MAERKSGSGEKAGMNVDMDLVRELAELLAQSDLTEIEVEDDDRKIRVARTVSTAAVAINHPLLHLLPLQLLFLFQLYRQNKIHHWN